MPITFDYIEPGIYMSRWSDPVSIDEFFDYDARHQSVAAHGDTTFVNVIDVSALTKIPVTVNDIIKTTRRVRAANDCLGYLIIRPSLFMGSIVRVVNRIITERVEVVQSYDNALRMARDLLAEHEKSLG